MPPSDTIVPPVLYLPVYAPYGGADRIPVVAPLVDGRKGLLVYTALDRLAEHCGRDQGWILLSTEELGRLKDLHPFDVVAFDLDARDLMGALRSAS